MTIAVAVLLVSTLSTTGLLALWAADSRRHWFLRTAAFLGVLSPLLLVPAVEPFIALSLQAVVVASGVGASRWALSRKRRKEEGLGWRFSMATLLLAMVLCGVAAAVGSQAPRLNQFAWQSVALIGLCGGTATLLGWWAVSLGGRCRWAGLVGALAVSMIIAAAPAWFDWFVLSFDEFADWPPDPTSAVAALYTLPERPLLTWFGIVPGVAACVFFGSWLAMASFNALAGSAEQVTRRRGWLVQGSFAAMLLVVALPAGSAMFCLLTPEPIPNEPLPTPNGIDDFISAGEQLASSPLAQQTLLNAATKAQLQTEVARAASALATIRVGLSRQTAVPVNYLDDVGLTNSIAALRNVGRHLVAEGRLAQLENRPADAVASYLDCVEFGIRSTRGGLMIDGLIGFASAIGGAKAVYDIRQELDAETCRNAAERFLRSLAELDPEELFHYRDRIWSQHSSGWHGRLLLGLTDLTGDHFMDMGPDTYLYAHNRNVATLRMVALELLARAHFLERGSWPQSVEEMQSSSQLPRESVVDPFDAAGGLLRMKPVESGVEFYSVGENGVDDGGIAPNVENEDGVMEGGDLRLSEVFKPQEWEALNAGDAEQEESRGDE